MAIDAYVGLPGHGKSYGVTEHVIIPSVKEGRHVVTNIPLEREELLADFGTPDSQITQLPEDWFERPDMADFVPAGSVLVLDELWRRWPAGLKANQANLADKALLAEHRHRVDEQGRSMRIVLVTQDLSQVAAWVRILVEQTYKMTKLTAVGSTKKFRVDIYRGAPTGQNIPKSHLIRQMFGQYKPEVYRYYKSATQSATGNVGDESKADRRGNLLKSPFIIFSLVAPIILIPLLIWYVVGIFSSGFGLVEDAEAQPEPVSDPFAGMVNPPPEFVPTPLVVAQVNPDPVLSSDWQVVGYLARGAGEGEETRFGRDFVILKSIAGMRKVPTSDCEILPDGYSWSCLVDGKTATPWSGMAASTHWANSGGLIQRTASVASGATNAGSAAAPAPVSTN